MAKTFNPNRQGGGTFSLVQDAQGNYSLKETGFDKLGALNLPELGAVAATTTAAKTETAADKTESEIDRQTAKAFKPPEPQNDRSLDLNLTSQAKDLSESLSNIDSGRGSGLRPTVDTVSTPTTIQDSMPRSVRTPFTIQDNMTKDPTESVFGKSMPEEAQPEVKLETQTAKQRTGKARIRGPRDLETQTGVAFGRPKEGTIDQIAADFMAKQGGTPMDLEIRQQNHVGTLGIKTDTTELDTARFAGSTARTLADPAEKEDVKPASRRTFSESVKTALKGFKTPTMAIVESVSDALTDPRQKALNDSNAAALGSLGYKTRGQLGSSTDPGRIAGNPAKDVFAGLNLKSARGDVMRGARNRVSTVQKTIDKALAKGDIVKAKRFQERKEKFNKQIEAAQKKKNEADLATGGVAPGASGGGGGSGGCFIKGTLVTMANGSKKPIEKVNLGDYVAEGGKVFATGKFLINDLYNYKGIKVSGSHMVKEDNIWTRVEDSKYGKLISTDEHVVYIFGSQNRRILIDNILFTDYFEVTDQEKLISEKDKFFDNWKIHEANEDINNINILNAN